MAETVKEEVLRLVQTLPAQVTWEDVFYEIHVRRKIALGIKDADEGKVITQEEVERLFLDR